MFRNEKMLKLFGKSSSQDQNDQSTFRMVVELSFEASFQVSYRDQFHNLKIKRLKSNCWSVDVLNPVGQAAVIEFKAFVYSPNLSKDEQISMRLYENGEIRSEKSYSILAENDHAGWFTLQYKPRQ